ncbi:leucine-rich repeat-containing protein 74B-like [Lineus longissimus]|uniref:leucine-rich repeat-containing protein 74B-like n=1 Tax=Lineus longissimus TaxID=88925 RepID=UPI00315D02DD
MEGERGVYITSSKFYDDDYYNDHPEDFKGHQPPAYGQFQQTHRTRKKLVRKRESKLSKSDTEKTRVEAQTQVPGMRRDASNYNLVEPEGEFFDPDFDFDGDDNQEGHDEHIDQNQRTYELACKGLGILPSRNFIKALRAPRMNMAHQEIGARAMRPCIIALVRNTQVLDLDISGNSIGPEGAQQIASLLTENMFITNLNLSDNGLKSEGAKILTDVLRENRLVTNLKLSGNGFEEGDANHFAKVIQENAYITELDLSHNGFREQGGIVLAEALQKNKYLEKLDLSWNHLRWKGAIAMAKLLAVNHTITHLNLAWNGFGAEGCNHLADNLPKNTTLLELDLTCNRIDRACLNTLLRGIGRNKSLNTLKMSKNPITAEGATAVVKTIEENPNCPLEFIDITGQCVEYAFADKLSALKAKRKFDIKHGIVLEEKEGRKDQDDFTNEDPMMVLMEFMRLRNLRLMDLFVALDADGSKSLEREEFRDGLMKIKVPMSTKALDRLINKLDADGDGEVDYKELMDGQKDHKRRMAKMQLEAKEKGIAYEDTDMGRLTKKLKAILAFSNTKKVQNVVNVSKAVSRLKGGLPATTGEA